MDSGVRRIGARGAVFARGCLPLRRRHALPIIITGFLGVAFSVAGSHAIFHWADRAAELELSARVNNITGTLQTGIDEYLDRVAALRAFFKSSEHGVRRSEFTAFTQDLLRGRSAILSLSWVPRVSRDERPAHELAAARDGVVGYQIKSVTADGTLVTAPERSEYFPVYYTTERKDARRVLGLDLADGGVREDTLRRAREHDRFAASKLFVLFSGIGDRRGFFVSSPVFKKGLPQETVEERARNLDGFVQGVFQLDIMIETIIGGIKAPLDVYIFASNSDPQALPIHVQSSALRASPAAPRPMAALTAGPHWISPLRVADLEWSLVAVPIPTENANGLMGWMLLGAGLLVTGIVTAFMGASARHAQMLTRANRQVSELAETDPLTSLANRRAFMHQLGVSFAADRRAASPFALLYIDLDHFKDINDTLGHPIGDRLLRQAAERLKATVRDCDLVARFGGDEFAVLQAHAGDLAASGVLARTILERLREPYVIDGNEVHTTASIGISHSTPGVAEPEAALIQADLALYRAKEDGRDCFRFHNHELDQRVQERVSIGDELRLAIGRRELELHYQPQVDIRSGQIVGLEALARWRHPRRGWIAPSVFIPIAEKTGSIVELGKWVFDEACRQQRTWEDAGIAPPSLAVNLSAIQCRRAELDSDIQESLERWNVDPRRIEIELTESVLLEATQGHADIVARLRMLGVAIALDDFGTGYSSLNYLTKYPVDRLKIAQELVFEVTTDSRHATVVRTAIRLAEELGIEIIAEGVETAGQALFLLSAGCRHAQGFYFGRPVNAEQVTELLRQARAPSAEQGQRAGELTAA